MISKLIGILLDDVLHCDTLKSKERLQKHVTLREYFVYHLQERYGESPHIFYSRRLFQQFFVDAYTMVESYRLTYIRNHHKDLRCDSYTALDDTVHRGDANSISTGRRIIFPSSFTGGARYMIQNYHDAIGLCRFTGYLNLFIMFTCNPKWPEVIRFLNSRGLRSEDRLDSLSHFPYQIGQFNKRNSFLGDFLEKLRPVIIYTIEFQKRGLPHAHIFLRDVDNSRNFGLVDDFISAEIPEKNIDEEYYDAISEYLIHGPRGLANKNSPCMSHGRCMKHFPKKFVDNTTVDVEGYVVYR
ncbi:hypothetical protein OROMI_009222 [Orobanche minor]